MAPPVERLHFSIFDLHLWKTPLVDPAVLNPKIRFVAEPAECAKILQARTKIELPNLWVFPLSYRADRSRFWRHYVELAQDAPEDVRNWLLPLRCRPKKLDLVFETENPKLSVPSFATIWLWPFGWASSLEFALRAPLTFNEVRTIVEALQGKTKIPPFMLANQRTSLPKLFEHLAQLLTQDVFVTGGTYGEDLMIAKHVILSVVPTKDSEPKRYGPTPPTMAQWSDADRGRLHAALLGEMISGIEVIKRENESAFLLTQLEGASFGLTYFQTGTLLMLEPGKYDEYKWRETGRCFARNVSGVSLVALALQRFIDRRERLAAGRPAIAKLADAASKLLDDLATGYANRFARRFLAANASVRRARAA